MLGKLLSNLKSAPETPAARAPDGRRIYAFGDIHGRCDLLTALIQQIDADGDARADKPILVFLGDYVDRGRESRAVLDQLIALDPGRYELVFLRGNHEAALLNFLEKPETGAFWMQIGGGETLRSYGIAPLARDAGIDAARAAANALRAAMPAAHLAFLEGLQLSARLGDYCFVHAGLRPGRSLDEQSPHDLLSIREPFLASKTRWPFVIVHGHSPVEQGFRDERRIGVDTGAYATGRLSAARLEGESVSFLST